MGLHDTSPPEKAAATLALFRRCRYVEIRYAADSHTLRCYFSRYAESAGYYATADATPPSCHADGCYAIITALRYEKAAFRHTATAIGEGY